MRVLLVLVMAAVTAAQSVALTDCCCGASCLHPNACTGCTDAASCPGGNAGETCGSAAEG